MRLHDLGQYTDQGRTVLHATVAWEDRDRAPLRVFVEASTGAPMTPRVRPEVFLPMVATTAHVHGERRLSVEGPVDPTMLAGVHDALF